MVQAGGGGGGGGAVFVHRGRPSVIWGRSRAPPSDPLAHERFGGLIDLCSPERVLLPRRGRGGAGSPAASPGGGLLVHPRFARSSPRAFPDMKGADWIVAAIYSHGSSAWNRNWGTGLRSQLRPPPPAPRGPSGSLQCGCAKD